LTTSQQALTPASPGTLGSNIHFCRRFFASRANSLLHALVTYITPSITSGVDSLRAMRRVEASNDHASPSCPTLPRVDAGERTVALLVVSTAVGKPLARVGAGHSRGIEQRGRLRRRRRRFGLLATTRQQDHRETAASATQFAFMVPSRCSLSDEVAIWRVGVLPPRLSTRLNSIGSEGTAP